MAAIEVVRPGALTTVQDLGRPGLARFGVPRGGAFDSWAARAANRRVGNPDAAALLEITLSGPALRFEDEAVVALVGDDFEIEAEDAAGMKMKDVQRGKRLRIGAGSTLSIGRARSGVRAWLAIGGGIDVPEVLGSRSTDLAGGFGGVNGRALRAGDGLLSFPSPNPSRPQADDAEPAAGRGKTGLRILPGPDRFLLPAASIEALAERELRVSPRSDRRGVRLEGGRVDLAPHAPRRSQPMLAGAIEATPGGELIVLGVDAPVTGGYPWVAQVIAADLGVAAHLGPGAAVRLAPVGLDAAEEALAARWRAVGGKAAT